MTKFVEGIYSKSDLIYLDTIEQAWDGSELKIDSGDEKIWLTRREHRMYDGDYVRETIDPMTGRWEQEFCLFSN